MRHDDLRSSSSSSAASSSPIPIGSHYPSSLAMDIRSRSSTGTLVVEIPSRFVSVILSRFLWGSRAQIQRSDLVQRRSDVHRRHPISSDQILLLLTMSLFLISSACSDLSIVVNTIYLCFSRAPTFSARPMRTPAKIPSHRASPSCRSSPACRLTVRFLLLWCTTHDWHPDFIFSKIDHKLRPTSGFHSLADSFG